MFAQFFQKFAYRPVGTVHGFTTVTHNGKDTGIAYHGHWVLKENGFGWRRVSRSGDPGESSFAKIRGSQVYAWKKGGPLPPLSDEPVDPPRKAKLIVFPGGK